MEWSARLPLVGGGGVSGNDSSTTQKRMLPEAIFEPSCHIQIVTPPSKSQIVTPPSKSQWFILYVNY